MGLLNWYCYICCSLGFLNNIQELQSKLGDVVVYLLFATARETKIWNDNLPVDKDDVQKGLKPPRRS